jgi:exopolysaccharide production protein ExoQ
MTAQAQLKPRRADRFLRVADLVLTFLWFYAIIGVGADPTGKLSLTLYVAAAYFLARIAFNLRSTADIVVATPALWVVPGFALLSVLWSVSPPTTLRASGQLILTALVAIHAARMLGARTVLMLVAAAAGLVMYQNLSHLEKSGPGIGMTGGFGSKNYFAIQIFPVFIACAAYLTLARKSAGSLSVTIAALITLPIAAYALIRAESAAMNLIVAVVTLFCLGVYIIRYSVPVRLFWLLAGLAVATFGLFYYVNYIGQNPIDFVLHALGKERSLSGRDIIWRYGFERIEERPWLGWGYQAIWNIASAGTWREYLGWDNNSVVYFHNTYIEYGVGLGIVGLGLVLVSFVFIYTTIFRCLFQRPDFVTAFYGSVALMVAMRSWVEVEAFWPQSTSQTLLWVGAVALPHYVRLRTPEGLAASRGGSSGAAFLRGPLQGQSQGCSQGCSQGASQGASQGYSQGASWGASRHAVRRGRQGGGA